MSYSRKGVTFIGAISLMLTLIFFHPFFLEHISVRHILMTFAYIFIALAMDNYNGIGEVIEGIWNINDNGDSPDEKFALIKSFLQINVSRWDTINSMYGEIVNNSKRTNALKRYLMRIPLGRISLKQFIWILGYIIFGVYTSDAMLSINNDGLHFVIDLFGLAYFIYSGSKVIGIGEFMGDIFQAIKPVKGKSNKLSMQLLESQIIFGARHFAFLKKKIKLKKKEVIIND